MDQYIILTLVQNLNRSLRLQQLLDVLNIVRYLQQISHSIRNSNVDEYHKHHKHAHHLSTLKTSMSNYLKRNVLIMIQIEYENFLPSVNCLGRQKT